jgi:insulysin
LSFFSFQFLLRVLSKLLFSLLFFILPAKCLFAGLPNYFEAAQFSNNCTIDLKNVNFLKIKLANEIEVLLISDPSLKYSSASLSIPYGGSSDPKNYPGVAHFVEHLLFLGNKSNPKENHFLIHTSNHGGYCNALTDYDKTCYYFKISDNYFEESLKLFRNLFISPLFTDSAIEREAHAINEEFFMHKQSIGFLYDEVCAATRNPHNCFNKFYCGNLQTLGQIKRDIIQEWYNSHYSSNQMRVILLSPRPLNDLEKLAELFTFIENKHLHLDECSEPIMKKDNFGQIVYLETKDNYQYIVFEWEIPIDLQHDIQYLSFLLTSSHASSLQSTLFNNGLGVLLNPVKSCKGSSFIFSLQINLTDKGIKQLDNVIGHTFDYLNLIKKRGGAKELFNIWQNEKKEMYSSSLNTSKQLEIYDLSKALMDEDFETFPEKTYIGNTYNEDNLYRLFNSLTASKCQFILIGNEAHTKVKCQNETPFFKARYTLKRFEKKQLNKWDTIKSKSKLQLPDSIQLFDLIDEVDNDAINNFDIHLPLKISDEEGFSVFKACNIDSNNDRCYCSFHIKFPFLKQKNPKDLALLALFCDYINENILVHPLVKLSKQLDIALIWTLSGLQLRIEANLSDANELIKDIFTIFKLQPITQTSFKNHKANLINLLNDLSVNDQLSQFNDLFEQIEIEYPLPLEQICFYMKKLTQKELENFSRNCFNSYCIEGLFLGNISDEKCIEIQKALKKQLKGTLYSQESCFKEKNLLFSNNKGPFKISKTSNNPYNFNALIIQNESYCPKDLVLMDILEFLINPIFMKELRTKKQTAYYLNTRHLLLKYTSSLSFEIQSVGFSPQSLNDYTECFIEKFLNNLNLKIPQDLFEKAKSLHLNHYKKHFNTKEEIIDYYESLLSYYSEDMHIDDKKNQCIKSITYADFITFTKKLLSRSNKRRLSIQLEGNFSDKKVNDKYTIPSIEEIRTYGEFIGLKIE